MSAIETAHQLIKEHSKSGRLVSQVSSFDQNIIINTAFFKNGNIRFRFTVKDGRLHGPGKIYYENLQIKEEIPFHKGLIHGVSRGWFENGQTEWEATYVNNQLHGQRRHWFVSSVLESEYLYRENALDGECLQWHENGQLKERGHYLGGQRHGIFKEYDRKGRISKKELYVKGICYTGKLKRLINKKLSCRQIASVKSGAIRRIMMEEVGYARFAQELDTVILDRRDEQELLRIDWHPKEEPLYLVKVKCPTTGAFYTLRVPPFVKSVKEAVAWTFNQPENHYLPTQET